MPEETGAAPAEGVATTETTPAETTAAPDPWAGVMDRVGQLASDIDTRFTSLEQRIPEQEPEPEANPWDSLFPDEPEVDQFGQPVQPQPQFDQQALNAAFQQALQQANAPLVQQLQQFQMERGREQLYAEIPQLKDPEVAQKTIQGMQSFLAGAGAPPEVAGWLTNSPQAIAQYFKAAEAERLAAGQAPASEQIPAVEAAGGAAPGGSGEQPNIIQRIHEGAWELPKGLR